MQPHVPLEVVLEAEAESADVADEGLLFGVDDPVLDQAHLTFEGFGTLRTLVRPLVRVRALVDAEVGGGGEAFAAGFTGIGSRSGVDRLVVPQTLPPATTWS